MELSWTVSKVGVVEKMDKMWGVMLSLLLNDDAVEVWTKNFQVRYRTGQNIQDKVEEILAQMQEAIDDYVGEQTIFDSAALDTAVTYLQNNLTG